MNKANESKSFHYNLKKKKLRLLITGLTLITVIWAMLYLPNLRTCPSWYGDEILTLDIGKSLVRGEMANRALSCTFASVNYNYQPAFAFVVGLGSWLTGGDILGGRLVSVLIGLVTAWVGFFFLGKRFGLSCGLFFSFVLLGYTQSIIHYRWIYPHNLVGLGLLASTCLLMRPASTFKDLKAGLFLSLGAGAHLLAIHSVIASVIVRLFRPRCWLSIALPPFIVLSGTLIILNLTWRGWVFEDLMNLKKIYQAYSNENGAGFKWLQNIAAFFLQDGFHLAAITGIIICLRTRAYALTICSLFMVLMLTKNRQNLPLFYYQAMVVLPLFASAIAVSSNFVSVRLFKYLFCKRFKRVQRTFLPLLGIGFSLSSITSVLSSSLPVKISPWVVSDTRDYETAASWLNTRTETTDLVIAYWNLGWLLKCRNADVLMATAWAGLSAGDNYDPPPARNRFLYSLDLKLAKFFVITELDEHWAYGQGVVYGFLKDSGVFSWPLVFQAGSIRILKNPALSGSGFIEK